MVHSVLAALLAFSASGQHTTPDIYDEPVSTVLGCECKTETCTTSVTFECDAAPFCAVRSKDCANGTADYSVTFGYYDYCVYKPYAAYESKTAQEKKALVLAKVNADGGTSGVYPSTLNVLTGIMGESVMVSFDASSDVFPETRGKYIHSVGVTGGIKFESSGSHSYDGLFNGAEHGIVRFSSAKQPAGGDSGGVAPGMGIKFFRDGRQSSNFVAMFSLDGQPCTDTDFFSHDWSNHIALTDNFGLKIIAAKFWQASYCPLQVGLSDLATGPDGAQGSFPYQLIFKALVASDCPCTDYVKCLANLGDIAVGTKIFEVRAMSAPKATPELIGTITLTDKLVTSKFGDEKLFFQHQHMEKDFKIKPDWLSAIDRKTECGMGCTGTVVPPISKGCSSPFSGASMLSSDANVTTIFT